MGLALGAVHVAGFVEAFQPGIGGGVDVDLGIGKGKAMMIDGVGLNENFLGIDGYFFA